MTPSSDFSRSSVPNDVDGTEGESRLHSAGAELIITSGSQVHTRSEVNNPAIREKILVADPPGRGLEPWAGMALGVVRSLR